MAISRLLACTPATAVRKNMEVLLGMAYDACAGACAGVELIAPSTCSLVCGALVPIPTFCAAAYIEIITAGRSSTFFIGLRFCERYDAINWPFITVGCPISNKITRGEANLALSGSIG